MHFVSTVRVFVVMIICVFANSRAGAIASNNQRAVPVSFDVASIHIHAKADGRWRSTFTNDGYSATGVTLKQLLQDAFDSYESYQLTGLPPWAESQHFDIEAKVSPDDAMAFSELPSAQKREMLIVLLEHRFQLRFHKEDGLKRGYHLVIGRRGLSAAVVHAKSSTGQALWTRLRPGTWAVQECSAADLAHMLALNLKAPVDDATGLVGRFDLHLDWDPTQNTPSYTAQSTVNSNETPGDGISIFTALKEQLGLELRPTQLAIRVQKIDAVFPPSEN